MSGPAAFSSQLASFAFRGGRGTRRAASATSSPAPQASAATPSEAPKPERTSAKRRRTRPSAASDDTVNASNGGPASPRLQTAAALGTPAAPGLGGDDPLAHPLVEIAQELSQNLSSLKFGSPVTHVYNPYDYALDPYDMYCRKFGTETNREVLLLGMNPGPFGMAQTGVPFGIVSFVRDWMGISGEVGKPAKEHPARPIEGFACPRSEVSGARLWGWARDTFGTPEAFFSRFFVANYCPLVFMEGKTGKNRTPDQLREKKQIFEPCDHALRRTILHLRPRYVIGVGKFAQERARIALEGLAGQLEPAPVLGSILHPSPASPAANRDWVGTIEREFKAMGVDLPPRRPAPPQAAEEEAEAEEAAASQESP
eukprot:tig00021339_g20400.t1